MTTLCLLVLATPIAWLIKGRVGPVSNIFTAIVALPIVLPPSVLGFYLLVAMGPKSPLMIPLQLFGIRTLDFTFSGLLIGSILYSLPFAVQPIRNSFQAMGTQPLELAASLGSGPFARFFKVALPLAQRGYISAALLVFAHTLGEFGVVLIIGGSIPGRTQVVAIRIYELVESGDFAAAHHLALGLVILSLGVMLSLLLLENRSDRTRHD